MYGVTLIPGIFQEMEIYFLDEDMIKAIEAVLNDEIAKQILITRESLDTLGLREKAKTDDFAERLVENIDNLYFALEDKIKMYTMHLEAEKREIVDFCRTLNLLTLLDTTVDKRTTLENLNWFFDNKKYWISNIPARDKDAYDHFYFYVKILQRKVEFSLRDLSIHFPNVKFNYTKNLSEVVDANKVYFKVKNETSKVTRMAMLIKSAPYLEQARHGLEYSLYCEENRIPTSMRMYVQLLRRS